MKKQEENNINRAFFDIMQGAGWCTDGYIINCMLELSKQESFELMIRLARKRLLFDEDVLEEGLSDNKPDVGVVTDKWVEEKYGQKPDQVDNSWLTYHYLQSLGYYQISDDGKYGVYQNEHLKVSSPTYGPLPKDYRKISFYRDKDHGIMLGVRSDWDTRYSIANAVAKNQEIFEILLNSAI
jgi:hypothetical protein